jgi:FkbM family methyltransferase
MYKHLKALLKKSKSLVWLNSVFSKKIARAKFEIKDIHDSYLSRPTKLMLTPYGFKLSGSQSMHHIAMQHGKFEPDETALFCDIFERTDVFVDVGANIGFYSCLAKYAGKHVVAVEPLTKNLDFIHANFLVNQWNDIEIFPLGLGKTPGMATLYGASSTGASLIGSWAGASKYFQRTIAISTLDILLGNRFNGKKLFIKIDVEGVEYAVLEGALGTLVMEPKPVWVIEICLNEYHPQGNNPGYVDTFKLFVNNGYHIRTADRYNKTVSIQEVEQWAKQGRCDSGTINYKFEWADR